MKQITTFIKESDMVDEDMVRELALWFEHTKELWKRGEATVNSMIKKSKKEEMTLDYLQKSSIVDKLTTDTFKSYNKAFGISKLSTATRAELKKAIAQSIWDFYNENK